MHYKLKELTQEDISNQIESLERQTKYLRVLNTFSIALMSQKTLGEVYWYVANEVVSYLGFEDCVVYRVNPEKGMLKAVSAGASIVTESEVTQLTKIKIGEGIAGSCAASGEPILVGDTRQDSRYKRDKRLALSELAVPILLQGEVIGVIDCEHGELNHYTKEHEQILMTVAALLSTKIENMMMMQDLQDSIDKLEDAERLQAALFRIASMTASFDEIERFYQQIHEVVSSLIYAENFYIALFDSKSSLLRFPYLSDQQSDVDPNELFPSELLGKSLTGMVFRGKKPLMLNREDIIEMVEQGEIELYGEQCESWLGVPFHSNDDVQGVVVVQSYNESQVYTKRDKEILIFVSQHISNALERVLTEQKFQHQALHDALTNLPNRVLFMDRIEHALDRVARHVEEHIAVMYLDLDRFKLVNDTLGHLMGDSFLIKVSEIIGRCIREVDTLARLGGDEFAILLEDLPTRQAALDIADRIIAELIPPIHVDGVELRTSVSIGVAFQDNLRITAVDLLKQADIAMFKSKEEGRGTSRVFTPDMANGSYDYLKLDVELKRAIEQEELELYYQPIYDIKTSNISGMEALIRWNHPERGLVYPCDFIEYAEESNLIVSIDRYVLEKAVQQGKEWVDKYDQDFYISTNICGRSLSNVGFVEFLVDTIKSSGLPDGMIAIELTERALISNTDLAKRTLQRLRDNNIKILLDDFGTGYSSLSYLHMFPLDCLKIDRSFITMIENSAFESPLVKTIVALANALNMEVVAEGIEMGEQQDYLRRLDCSYGQGYLFSRPVPAREMEAFLMNGKLPDSAIDTSTKNQRDSAVNKKVIVPKD